MVGNRWGTIFADKRLKLSSVAQMEPVSRMDFPGSEPGLATRTARFIESMSDQDTDQDGFTNGSAVVEPAKPKLAKPPLWKVVLLNDDYTPMEFVVEVLQVFFRLDREEATVVMLHVHRKGKGVCGVFTREIAETKVAHVTQFARESKHPLLCEMEED